MQTKTEQYRFFPTLIVIAQSLLETTPYPLPRTGFHSFRGNRFFAPLEAFGELLHKTLFCSASALVSKTVFGLFLRQILFAQYRLEPFPEKKDPIYLRRDRAKKTLYCVR